MLSRLILLVIQLVVAGLATEPAMALLPPFGGLRIFVYAVVAALIVYLVGLVLSQILRDTAPPSHATLLAAILCALAGALLFSFRADLPAAWRNLTRALREDLYPLLGAVVGYWLKR
jgi:hypothetical protein